MWGLEPVTTVAAWSQGLPDTGPGSGPLEPVLARGVPRCPAWASTPHPSESSAVPLISTRCWETLRLPWSLLGTGSESSHLTVPAAAPEAQGPTPRRVPSMPFPWCVGLLPPFSSGSLSPPSRTSPQKLPQEPQQVCTPFSMPQIPPAGVRGPLGCLVPSLLGLRTVTGQGTRGDATPWEEQEGWRQVAAVGLL